jgi:hypothetical protein
VLEVLTLAPENGSHPSIAVGPLDATTCEPFIMPIVPFLRTPPFVNGPVPLATLNETIFLVANPADFAESTELPT